MKKIVLDVDGVLLSFMPAFDEAAAIVLKKKILVHKDENKQDFYHLAKRVGTDEKKVDEILEYMQTSGMYAKFKPLPGVKEALDAIKGAGFHITVVTALPEKAKAMRLANLKEALDFVPDEIHCVGMGKSKEAALREVNPDVFIDDRIDYLASAPFVYHLAWCDQKESQKDNLSQVDVHVHSLKEWVDEHMPRIVKKLDRHYHEKNPLQGELKLESGISSRKHTFK